MKNGEIYRFYWFWEEIHKKERKRWFFVVFMVSGRIAPLRDLWICFVFQWFGKLLGVRARGGVRFPFLCENHEKSWNHEISEFSWNFKKFHENHEMYGNRWFLWIWRVQNLDIPEESLVFLQCHEFHEISPFPVKFMKSMKFHHFPLFRWNQWKSHISWKKCPTAPRGPKKAWNFIG